MDEQVLGTAINEISNEINLPSVEVTNKSVASENSGVSVATRNLRTKNLRKKKETEKKIYVCPTRKSEKITEQKIDGTNPTTACEEANDCEQDKILRRNSKRKTAAKEMSESVTVSEREEDTKPMTADKIINDSEENKDVSAKEPKKKTITRKSIDVTESQTKDDASQMVVDKNIDNSEHDQNRSTQKSKRKTTAHPPTSEMVLEFFKRLRKRSGASAEDIDKYVEENYQVNMNRIKPHINRFLLQGVANGLLKKVSGNGANSKFKIKKVEKMKKKIGKIREKVNRRTGKAKNVTGKAKRDKQVMAKKSTRNYVK